MSKLVRRRWETDPRFRPTPRDRASCDYEAYVPDPLVGRPSGSTATWRPMSPTPRRPIARFDATAVGPRRHRGARSAAAAGRVRRLVQDRGSRGRWPPPAAGRGRTGRRNRIDVTATEVLGNIDAMTWALGASASGDASRSTISSKCTGGCSHGTRLRATADGSATSRTGSAAAASTRARRRSCRRPPITSRSCSATSASSATTTTLPAVVQAAIAHAQFETIHPFVDGNGRIGRALIHLVLRRRGLAPRVLPPISLVLATWSQDYVDGLTATRYRRQADSTQRTTASNRWIGLFATACRRAVEDAETFEERVAALQARLANRARTPSARGPQPTC